MHRNTLTGVVYALAAHTIWGLLPVYWKALDHVNALETLGHRIVWSVLAIAVALAIARRWQEVCSALSSPRELAVLGVTTVLVAANWGIYIWAVNHELILQVSMGYFLAPLLSVLFGMLMFGERLRAWQWLAVGLAVVGVANQFISSVISPWIGLSLSLTFVAYGALRKLAATDAISGLFVETALLAPLALAGMIWLGANGQGAFLTVNASTDMLLLLAGALTAAPLILYVAAARKLQLSTVGLLAYVTPSLQFLIGAFVYLEPIAGSYLISFGLIWAGLAVYTFEGQQQARKSAATRVA